MKLAEAPEGEKPAVIVSGDRAAYTYLPASVQAFPGRREWTATMVRCGYANVRHRAFTFGLCRMYIGEK